MQVTTYTNPGTDAVRVHARARDGSADYGYSVPVAPDSDGYARVRIDGLPAATELEYRVQAQFGGGFWTGLGGWRPARTAPPPGTAEPSFRWLGWSCVHHEKDSRDQLPFLRAMRRAPQFGLLCGDQNYSDVRALNVRAHLAAWEKAWRHVPGMHDLMANVPHGVEVSDHDSGEGGNRGSSSRAIPYQMSAFYKMLPQDSQVSETRAFAFTWGRFDFICPDFRTEFRTSAFKYPADDPRKTSYGAAQMAWIGERITAAKAAGHFIFFITDAVWLGGYQMKNKPDCHANYQVDRRTIADQLVGYPHMIVDFDFHCLRLNADGGGSPSGGPVVGAAGMVANSGNFRGDGVYSWLHNHPGKPVREFVDFDCSDSGTTWTVTANFFDVLVDRMNPINQHTWTWPVPQGDG
jgi:hypothetical protein